MPKYPYVKMCKECLRDFTVKESWESRKEFCGKSCSCSFTNKNRSEESRKSRRDKLTKLRVCRYCGKIFTTASRGSRGCTCCSRSCGSKRRSENGKKMLSPLKAKEFGRRGGRASALKQVRRSKDEIRLFELCLAYFDGVEHNKILVDGWDADIAIPHLKLAILWNGPWHYKELHMPNHHLLQVQTRDKIKIDMFLRNGWTVRVFEDRHYTPESAFAELVSARQGSNLELAGYEPGAMPI